MSPIFLKPALVQHPSWDLNERAVVRNTVEVLQIDTKEEGRRKCWCHVHVSQERDWQRWLQTLSWSIELSGDLEMERRIQNLLNVVGHGAAQLLETGVPRLSIRELDRG